MRRRLATCAEPDSTNPHWRSGLIFMGAVFANGAVGAGLTGKHYFAYRPNFILMSTVLGC